MTPVLGLSFLKEAKFFTPAALPPFAKRAMGLFICIKYMSTPPPRISLSELSGHARIRDLLSITVKCKILKLSTKKMSRFFQAAPPPKKELIIIMDPRMGD